MKQALAAVFDGIAGELQLREFPIPVPKGSEMLIRILGCTLCGSDLHTLDGRRSVPVPTVLGHEIVGELLDSGDTAASCDMSGQPIRVGDRLTWAIVSSCGTCFFCERGLSQKCLHAIKYGHEAIQPGRELLGGLAEYCLLVPGTCILRLPDDMPLSVACPASCATATVTAALEAAGDLHDRHICLLGAGMLGLTACAMARTSGAASVTCIDPSQLRRERALLFGATRAADPDEFSAIAAETVGMHGFDAIIELSGNPEAFVATWKTVRLGGTFVLVGSVFPSDPVSLALEQVVRRQLTIRGIHNYSPRHLLSAVAFLTKYHTRFPFADLVSQWIPLSQVSHVLQQKDPVPPVRIGVDPTIRI